MILRRQLKPAAVWVCAFCKSPAGTLHAEDCSWDQAQIARGLNLCIELNQCFKGEMRMADCQNCNRGHGATVLPERPRNLPCNLGLGCEEVGQCYAQTMGRPEQCGAGANPTERQRQTEFPDCLYPAQCNNNREICAQAGRCRYT